MTELASKDVNIATTFYAIHTRTRTHDLYLICSGNIGSKRLNKGNTDLNCSYVKRKGDFYREKQHCMRLNVYRTRHQQIRFCREKKKNPIQTETIEMNHEEEMIREKE